MCKWLIQTNDIFILPNTEVKSYHISLSTIFGQLWHPWVVRDCSDRPTDFLNQVKVPWSQKGHSEEMRRRKVSADDPAWRQRHLPVGNLEIKIISIFWGLSPIYSDRFMAFRYLKKVYLFSTSSFFLLQNQSSPWALFVGLVLYNYFNLTQLYTAIHLNQHAGFWILKFQALHFPTPPRICRDHHFSFHNTLILLV